MSQPNVLPEDGLKVELEWEDQMTKRGIDRYRKMVTNAVATDNEDRLPAQNYLLKQSIQPMVKALGDLAETMKKPGRKHKCLHLLLALPHDQIALLTSKVVMSGISTKRSFHSMSKTLGHLLQEQVGFNAATYKQDRTERINTKRKLKSVGRKDLKSKIANLASTKQGTSVEWDHNDQLAIGMWLIKQFADNTGLVRVSVITSSSRSTTFLTATDKCMQRIKQADTHIEMLRPVFLPMLIEPKPWTNFFDGGYETRKLSLVKTRVAGYLDDPLNLPDQAFLDAVNALQSTAWCINSRVLDVVKQMWEDGSTLAELPAQDPEPLPPLPNGLDSSDDEAIKAFKIANPVEWKKFKQKRVLAHGNNARLVSKRLATHSMIQTAEELDEFGRFYFVYQADWRGRLYPVSHTLSPQGTSLSKGLLQFSEGKELGERGAYWLKIGLANTFGVDKVSYEDRIQWVQDHDTAICLCANDPLTFKMWTEADSPWEFLANCFEYEQYKREGSSMISYVPQRVDGSCNGLQHLSAVLLDERGGRATNLVPANTPSDIYREVANIVSAKVAHDAACGDAIALAWDGKVDRTTVKRPVMTLSYGSTDYGRLEQIRTDMAKDHDGTENVRRFLGITDDDSLFQHYKYLSDNLSGAIDQVVKAAPAVMGWLQDVAGKATENGLPIMWKTPVGLSVLQAYPKLRKTQIDVILGEYRIRNVSLIPTSEYDKRKTELSIAPNWVHALDAAHCQDTINRCTKEDIHSFAMVHDSYGTHACDMDDLSRILRESFINLHSANQMQQWLEQVKAQVPPSLAAQLLSPPTQGSLKLDDLINSRYFFA